MNNLTETCISDSQSIYKNSANDGEASLNHTINQARRCRGNPREHRFYLFFQYFPARIEDETQTAPTSTKQPIEPSEHHMKGGFA